MTTFSHDPVLVEPLLEFLDPQPGQIMLDGTVGLGGHAAVFAPRLVPGGRYIGLDLDAQMLEGAKSRLVGVAGDVELVHANYADLVEVLSQLGLSKVDLMLLDLGLNSAQLDDPVRGFSFDRDGPLDMRFSRDSETRALDIVNKLDERELADLFYEFGQEGMSRKIAKRICQVRHDGRITTTLQLARAVESAYMAGGEGGGGKTHCATRVFQALRIAVNRELDNLKRFMQAAPKWLNPGGKLAVISFHSLEDGIVKDAIRQGVSTGELEDLTKRPVIAEGPERGRNPRSRSAKLRVARRK